MWSTLCPSISVSQTLAVTFSIWHPLVYQPINNFALHFLPFCALRYLFNEVEVLHPYTFPHLVILRVWLHLDPMFQPFFEKQIFQQAKSKYPGCLMPPQARFVTICVTLLGLE